MSNVADFLEARVAEDEELANAATGGPWTQAGAAGTLLRSSGTNVALFSIQGHDTQHAVRWHPDRVLAECKAKRVIIQLRVGDKYAWADDAARAALDDALIALAQPYSDHPDFNPAWQVEP